MEHFVGILPLLLILGWGTWFIIRSMKNQAINRAQCERNTAAIQENTAVIKELIAKLDQGGRR